MTFLHQTTSVLRVDRFLQSTGPIYREFSPPALELGERTAPKVGYGSEWGERPAPVRTTPAGASVVTLKKTTIPPRPPSSLPETRGGHRWDPVRSPFG